MATHYCKTKKNAQDMATRLRKFGNTVTVRKVGGKWTVYSTKA